MIISYMTHSFVYFITLEIHQITHIFFIFFKKNLCWSSYILDNLVIQTIIHQFAFIGTKLTLWSRNVWKTHMLRPETNWQAHTNAHSRTYTHMHTHTHSYAYIYIHTRIHKHTVSWSSQVFSITFTLMNFQFLYNWTACILLRMYEGEWILKV